MSPDSERQVCQDWQRGLIRWTDAVAALHMAGLPALYALAYRLGVPLSRRFADEARLPNLALHHGLTSPVWRANPAWRPVWYRAFERDAREYGVGSPGHAQRFAEWFDRDAWWLIRLQRSVDYSERDWARMQRDEAADRERRREQRREIWLSMTFDPVPENVSLAVVEL